jgi:hypothetical protein
MGTEGRVQSPGICHECKKQPDGPHRGWCSQAGQTEPVSPYPSDTKWSVSAHWCRGEAVIESGDPRLGDPMPHHEPCGDKPCEITTIFGPLTTPASSPSSAPVTAPAQNAPSEREG